jgi:hypothetical protein
LVSSPVITTGLDITSLTNILVLSPISDMGFVTSQVLL